MARLTIEDCWWVDPRRTELAKAVGDEDLADIIALKAWRLAQQFWKQDRKPIPKKLFDLLRGASDLLRIGLAEVRGDAVYVSGSASYLDWINQAREGGRIGGVKSAQARRDKHGTAQPKRRTPPEAKTKGLEASYSSSSSSSFSFSDSEKDIATSSKNSDIEVSAKTDEAAGKGVISQDGATPTALAWRSYRDAFEKKYGSPPPWNAKIAGQLKSLVSRIPAEAAPPVAAFYLTHPGARYAAAMHPVGLLLMDAEKLYTEWQTGRQVTSRDVRQAEKTAGYKSQLERIQAGEI